MRLGPIPESPLGRIALAAVLVPVPLGDTMVALVLARTLMTATKLRIFDAVDGGARTANEVATACGTNARATGKLLFALAGARYLRERKGSYTLAPVAETWLLETSPLSLRDAVLHRYLDAELLEHAEEFVRTGEPLNIHRSMSDEQWAVAAGGALLWSHRIAQSVGVEPTRRTGVAASLFFAIPVILAGSVLAALEPVAVPRGASLGVSVHGVYTVLFVAATLFVASAGSFGLGLGLRDRRVGLRLAVAAGTSAAAGFLIAATLMYLLGWRVGAPHAAERATMLVVTVISVMCAALSAGRRHRSCSADHHCDDPRAIRRRMKQC